MNKIKACHASAREIYRTQYSMKTVSASAVTVFLRLYLPRIFLSKEVTGGLFLPFKEFSSFLEPVSPFLYLFSTDMLDFDLIHLYCMPILFNCGRDQFLVRIILSGKTS